MNAAIIAIIDTMKECLHVMDVLHVLQLFTSVAQKLELLASTSGCMASADDCNVPSEFMAFDDGVDNASFSQVPIRKPNVYLDRGNDSDNELFLLLFIPVVRTFQCLA